MRKLQLLTAILLLSAGAFAQTISGVVSDGQGKPMAGSTVSLLRAADSSVLKLAVTKEDGRFVFTGAKEGRYLLGVTHVGHANYMSMPFDVAAADVTVPSIALGKGGSDLKGVTVTARRPMVEVKADKTILNVEGTINSVGNDALELLRKSPGVTVDKDDNISLSGKNGVQVYIDGRPSPLSGADLAAYLKSLQSAQIEAIELITNPSAKYEAAGNAGIINIRLKRNKSLGANGSVNAGWNIGTFAKYNAGGSLNYRNKKWNLFSNYNYNRNNNENYFNLFRTTAVDTSFNQRSRMRFKGSGHGFKAGADFFANSRNTFGVMVNGNIGDNTFRSFNRTEIAFIPTNTIDRLLFANNQTAAERRNVNFNTNYRFADTSGHELNLDLDYGLYRNTSNQLQPNNIYDASGNTFKEAEIFNMLTPSDIDIYSLKADYEQNFKGGKLGIGTKISFVETDNTFQRLNISNSGSVEDNHNNFKYTENINALYVNYNKQFKKGFMIQAGLRAENTHSQGHSQGFRWDYEERKKLTIDSTLDRRYTDLFPSASVTLNKNPMKQWSITYSRRIDRPSYQNLNPFEFNLDKYTFQRGNTGLRPQYTNSFGITNTYKYKLTTALNYSHVSDVFAVVPDNEGTKGFIITKNVATQDIVSLNISLPFSYKWYSLFGNLNSYYSHFKGDIGKGNKVDLDVVSFNLYAQQTFKLDKNTTAEISSFYSAPSVWQGTLKSKEMWGIDLGLQRTILKGKATVKTSVTDIFKTMSWAGTSNVTGQILQVNGGWESRQFRLNLNYRFGNNQVKAARQRKTGLEDENKRTQGSGGLGQ
jgi:iron complex outermembrane receptor protein